MKKFFALLIGLVAFSTAQACNWTGENCSFSIYEEAARQIGNLKQNPKFMQEKFAELQEKAKYIDRKAASCSNWKCVNDTSFEYSSYVSKLTLAYMNTSKPVAAIPAPAPVQDKWLGQCVIAKKDVINAYVDQSASTKINGFNVNGTWTVTHADGKYVGLTTVPDYDKPNPNASAGKFVGWVSKADLQMQDLRNCN